MATIGTPTAESTSRHADSSDDVREDEARKRAHALRYRLWYRPHWDAERPYWINFGGNHVHAERLTLSEVEGWLKTAKRHSNRCPLIVGFD